MSNKDKQIKSLLKALAQRPVAYQKIYAQITGSVTAGLLLSQIVYWWDAVEREFDKTDSDLRDELAMGSKEFKNAKSKLKKTGLVKMKLKGVPRRTFYRLDKSALLEQISSWAQRDQLKDEPKGTKQLGRKGPAIPDNTQRLHQRKIEISSLTDLSNKNFLFFKLSKSKTK